MTNKPRKFKAKHLRTGKWVSGWYVLHHIPVFDKHQVEIVGYKEVHSLFNDEPSHRKKGGFWQEIDPNTLIPLAMQLDIFD